MIEVGETYPTDLGNTVARCLVVEVDGPCVKVKLPRSETTKWVTGNVFSSDEELLDHLEEKAHGYAHYAEETARRIAEVKEQEVQNAQDEADEMAFALRREAA